MSAVAVISAIVVFPILYFCLKGKKLRIALPIVFGGVFLEIFLVTPFGGNLGWFGSYSALLASLIYCRSSKRRISSKLNFEFFMLKPIESPKRLAPAAASSPLERALLTEVAVQNQENQAIWPSWFNELQKIETGQMLKPSKTRTVRAATGRFTRVAVDNGGRRLFY